MTANDNLPASDILRGADEIGAFLGLDRRTVYYMASKRQFPTFRMGAVICARRSTLLAWIAEQETAA